MLLVGGAVLTAVTSVLSLQDPAAAGDARGEVAFVAEERGYVVALGSDDLVGDGTIEDRRFREVTEGEAAATRCTVTHPDGAVDQLRGDRQAVSASVSSGYRRVGTFDGRAGPTRVACDGTAAPYVVHARPVVLNRIAVGLLVAGVLLGLLGVLQILRGTVWRPRRS